MQGDDGVAAVCRLQHKGGGVCALVVGYAVNPGQRVAGRPLIHAEDRLVYRQGQGDNTVAAVDGLQRVGVGARGGEGRVEETVATTVADLCRDGGAVGRVDGEVQRDHRVAAVGRRECLVIVSAHSICRTVPGVALADCFHKFSRFRMFQR